MKAWYVEHKDYGCGDEGETCVVVHAETRGKAIAEARGERDYLHDCDWQEIRATRKPALDDKPITGWNLYTLGGWWVHCYYCGHRIGEECYECDPEETQDFEPCEYKGDVYCNDECRQAQIRKWDHSCAISWKTTAVPDDQGKYWTNGPHLPTPMIGTTTYEDAKADYDAMWTWVRVNPDNSYWTRRVPAEEAHR